VGVLAAYALARFRFRGRQAFRFLFLLPQVTPAVAILVPMFVMFNSLNLTGTYLGIILAHLTLTLPFAIWMMTGFFEDSPIELEESAMIDGCTRLGALIKVVLPVLGPGIAATAALGFITSWNEFLFSSMLTGRDTRTLSVAITSFLTNRALDWGRTAAAGTLILLPVLVFAFFTQRYLVRGLSHGAVKG
jgi:multiple sugar transport system permease protein